MEKLSAKDEQRALAALEKAIEYANAGEHPTEALAKVAEEAQLPAPMVQRLVEAYNTSRTLHHLKKSAGAERAATFPLADPADVFQRLFPPQPETVQSKAAAAVHPDSVQEFAEFVKAARAPTEPINLVDRKPEPYARDPALRAKRAFDERNRMQLELQKMSTASSMLRDTLRSVIEKAGSYWRRATRVEPLDVVEKRAYSAYGQPAIDFIDVIVDGANLTDSRVGQKRASADELGESLVFDKDKEPYSYIADGILFANEHVKLAAAIEMLEDALHNHTLVNAELFPAPVVKQAVQHFLPDVGDDVDVACNVLRATVRR